MWNILAPDECPLCYEADNCLPCCNCPVCKPSDVFDVAQHVQAWKDLHLVMAGLNGLEVNWYWAVCPLEIEGGFRLVEIAAPLLSDTSELEVFFKDGEFHIQHYWLHEGGYAGALLWKGSEWDECVEIIGMCAGEVPVSESCDPRLFRVAGLD